MSSALAYRNGEWIPQGELSVPVTDAGFIQGLTVAEQLRTFAGRLFRMDEHLERLQRSLSIVGVELPMTIHELRRDAEQLASGNAALLPDNADLGLGLFVTPGTYSAYEEIADPGPLVAMHTVPLAFPAWANKYDQGQTLQIVETRQVPQACWPAELKCRSRMHYFLADREAAAVDPQARALLLDLEGHVMESSTANVVCFLPDEGLVSPPSQCILPGISVATLRELAIKAGIPWVERHLDADDVRNAPEVLLCSTSVCVLPVTRLDRQPIGEGTPGPVYRQLLAAWSRLVGVDIRQQAIDGASS